MEELKFIRQLWLDEFHEFDDSLPRIYEEVTGKKYSDGTISKNKYFGATEAELLKEVNALIFVVLLFQIVVEALFQVSECSGESGPFWFNLIQTQLKCGNQSSLLLICKCQFTLLEELFKIVEVLTKVDEVLARIVQSEKVCGYLVNLFDSTNKGKQVLLGDFVLIVDRQVFELRKSIIARGTSQFVIQKRI